MRFQSNSVASLQDINTLLGIPPPTLSTTPQAYVDPTDELWIADANIYGGHWKRARDAIRSQVYRANPYTTVINTETTLPFDTLSYGAYGEWNLATGVFTAPIAGIYRITASLHLQISVATRLYARFSNSGAYADALFHDFTTPAAVYPYIIHGSQSIPLPANGTMSVVYYTTQALAVVSPAQNSIWCQVHFEQMYAL